MHTTELYMFNPLSSITVELFMVKLILVFVFFITGYKTTNAVVYKSVVSNFTFCVKCKYL